jgi:hypothetical protein
MGATTGLDNLLFVDCSLFMKGRFQLWIQSMAVLRDRRQSAKSSR